MSTRPRRLAGLRVDLRTAPPTTLDVGLLDKYSAASHACVKRVCHPALAGCRVRRARSDPHADIAEIARQQDLMVHRARDPPGDNDGWGGRRARAPGECLADVPGSLPVDVPAATQSVREAGAAGTHVREESALDHVPRVTPSRLTKVAVALQGAQTVPCTFRVDETDDRTGGAIDRADGRCSATSCARILSRRPAWGGEETAVPASSPAAVRASVSPREGVITVGMKPPADASRRATRKIQPSSVGRDGELG